MRMRLLLALLPAFFVCNAAVSLEDELTRYIESVDVDIALAVIAPDGIMTGINADKQMPLMSVFKFEVALAVADRLSKESISPDTIINVAAEQILPDTYSPMRQVYPHGGDVKVRRLLEYMLALSDNNACDILIGFAGGKEAVTACMNRLGHDRLVTQYTEAEMHDDTSLNNMASPSEIVRLFEHFERMEKDACLQAVETIIENCKTGLERLAAPLEGTGCIIGHKTGTGDTDPVTGCAGVVNDVGYVRMPDGRRYVIAVMISRSAYDIKKTETIIAEISQIAYKYITH